MRLAHSCRAADGEGDCHAVDKAVGVPAGAYAHPGRLQSSGCCIHPAVRLASARISARNLCKAHSKTVNASSKAHVNYSWDRKTAVFVSYRQRSRCGLECTIRQPEAGMRCRRHPFRSLHCTHQRPHHRGGRPRTMHVATTSTRSEHPAFRQVRVGSEWVVRAGSCELGRARGPTEKI